MTTFFTRPRPIRKIAVPIGTCAGSRGLASCGRNSRAADDRPGDQVREEAQVQRDVDRRGALAQAAVDVDGVRDRLEREEAQADRQRDLHQRHRQPEVHASSRSLTSCDEEAVVLEDAQDDQVERHRDADEPLAWRSLSLRSISVANELVAERHAAQQEAELRVRRRVEDVADERAGTACGSRGRDMSSHEHAPEHHAGRRPRTRSRERPWPGAGAKGRVSGGMKRRSPVLAAALACLLWSGAPAAHAGCGGIQIRHADAEAQRRAARR